MQQRHYKYTYAQFTNDNSKKEKNQRIKNWKKVEQVKVVRIYHTTFNALHIRHYFYINVMHKRSIDIQ